MVVVMALLMVMPMAAAFFLVMVVFMRFLRMLQHFLHHIFQRIRTLYGLQNCFSLQFIQRRCNYDSLVIMVAHQLHALMQLFRTHLIRPGQQDGSRIFNLIDKKLPEIFDVHLRFCGVYHSHRAVYLHIQVSRHILHCLQHVRQLSHAGRLNQNTLRRICFNDLLQ